MKTLDAGPAGIRQPGSVVEVDDAEGKALVAGGYADVVDAPKKKARAAAKTDDAPTETPTETSTEDPAPDEGAGA